MIDADFLHFTSKNVRIWPYLPQPTSGRHPLPLSTVNTDWSESQWVVALLAHPCLRTCASQTAGARNCSIVPLLSSLSNKKRLEQTGRTTSRNPIPFCMLSLNHPTSKSHKTPWSRRRITAKNPPIFSYFVPRIFLKYTHFIFIYAFLYRLSILKIIITILQYSKFLV